MKKYKKNIKLSEACIKIIIAIVTLWYGVYGINIVVYCSQLLIKIYFDIDLV